MNAQVADWDDLRVFLAVARTGSLSGAARVAIGTPPLGVSGGPAYILWAESKPREPIATSPPDGASARGA